MVKYKATVPPEYHEQLATFYPDIFSDKDLIQTITFQVTENCCLQCTYCYQAHNTANDMTFDTAKLFIDKLLNDQLEPITTKTRKGVIFEFIGGEPFLMIDLMTQITDYIWESMIRMDHPWLFFSRISISSYDVYVYFF